MDYKRSWNIFTDFPKLGFFAGFSLYIIILPEGAMKVQRWEEPVAPRYACFEPKKMGARSARAPNAATSPYLEYNNLVLGYNRNSLAGEVHMEAN